LERGVEEDEEFSGDGDEGDFAGFAGGAEFLEEGFEDGVFADGVEAGEVEETANLGAAAGDMALAAELAAVVVERSQTGELGDGAAVQGAEFGHEAEEAKGAAPVDAGGLVKACGFGEEFGIGVAQGEELSLELFDFAIVEADGAFGLGLEPAVVELMKAGLFQGSLGDEMGALGEQRAQAQVMSGLGCIWLGRVGEAEGAEDAGIDAVGLGEDVTGTGEVANLARIDDADRDVLGVEEVDEAVLVAAGGLADDVEGARGGRFGAAEQIGKAGGVVGNGEDLVKPAAVDGRLGDIGSEVDRIWVHEIRRGGWR
jgi:hypothetical protein